MTMEKWTHAFSTVIPDNALGALIRNLARLKKIPCSPLARRPGMTGQPHAAFVPNPNASAKSA